MNSIFKFDNSKKILIVGSGGREHAMAHKFSESNLVEKIFVCPGNPGMELLNDKISIKNIPSHSTLELLKFALDNEIELTVIGPEDVLELGIVDLFRENGLAIVGPTKKASMLETSKSFAKKIMKEANVPTAKYYDCFGIDEAFKCIENFNSEEMVVKCDGLAAGKGVIVCYSKKEAKIAVTQLMKENLLEKEVNHVIIEELLTGPEVSVFALCNNELNQKDITVNYSILGHACDHKRLKDKDIGPNTGGMGTFSPSPLFLSEDEEWVSKNIFSPMLKKMKELKIEFSGILFAGLMKTKNGFKVIEFNVRLGDPETQVLLPLINEDLFLWFKASATGNLASLQNSKNQNSPIKSNLIGIHVVMAAQGYPGTEGVKIHKGELITLKDYPYEKGSVYFAGVKKEDATNALLTNGGRVLGITSLAKDFSTAKKNAYEIVSKINFKGHQFRTDIGHQLESEIK